MKRNHDPRKGLWEQRHLHLESDVIHKEIRVHELEFKGSPYRHVRPIGWQILMRTRLIRGDTHEKAHAKQHRPGKEALPTQVCMAALRCALMFRFSFVQKSHDRLNEDA